MPPITRKISFTITPSISTSLHMVEMSLTPTGVNMDYLSPSESTLSEGNATKDPKILGIRDSMCAWDPDAANLLKVVDTENLEALQALLTSGVHINGHGGSFHETALHRAAYLGWAAGVKYLVSVGASVYAKNQFGQTPLHYAATASKPTACIKLLLETGRPGVLDHRDMRGHTPLHDASAKGCVPAINLLLKAGALVSARDGNGETPLHKAARKQSVPSMVALLNAGGDLAAVDGNGESVLSYVLHHLPGTMDAVFDHCLVTNSPQTNAKTLEVTMNFLPLTGPHEKKQVQNLQTFVHQSHAKLLTHPLCEIFLHLKWMKVRKIFLIEVIFYLLYAVLTTAMTFTKFVGIPNKCNTADNKVTFDIFETLLCENDTNRDDEFSIVDKCQKCGNSVLWIKVLNGIVFTLTALILVQQLLSLLQNKLAWFRSLSGVLHVVITLLVLAVIPYPIPQIWQYHLASLLLLLMWTECMLLIGRFPSCGIYVVMFTRVAKVFLRIFAIYFCLLVAFCSAFYITMHCHYKVRSQEDEKSSILSDQPKEDGENTVFSNLIPAFIKTLTMMIGDVGFSDLNEELSHLQVTGHVIFVLFVILVSIILSNLLVALAVNDVQGLRNSAHLERLIKQTELVFKMEKNFATASYIASHVKIPKLVSWDVNAIPSIAHEKYPTSASTTVNRRGYSCSLNSPKKGNKLFFVRDKKCSETSQPSHLLCNVMECLRNRETYDKGDNKASMRTKRGSRIRRVGSDYTHDVGNDLKELEANMTELVSEKMEYMIDSHGELAYRMATLEDKLQMITELLAHAINSSAGSVPPSSSRGQPMTELLVLAENSGSVPSSAREVQTRNKKDEQES
ncbi:transient receptor potential channel pyrexia-like [Macrobrachium rosenbergii]|uniref:transient receptor potential channel pyrexia-like n=1 Tax=Macrobrachium rosenbergii TaxID=79674 RepID=UPI0034D51E07